MREFKLWSDEDIRFLRDNYQTKPTKFLSETLKRSPHSVEHKLSRCKLKRGRINYKLQNKHRKITPELAYSLGALFGDGSMKSNHRHYRRVLFSVKDEDFAEVLKYNFDKHFDIYSHYRYDQKRGQYVIQTGYKEICDFLVTFDINNILKCDRKMKGRFLRGIYDAEGHISVPKKSGVIHKIEFTNTNEKIIGVVSKLLKNFDINHTFYRRKKIERRPTVFNIYICGRDNFIKYRENIGFSIKRKSDKLGLLPRLHTDTKWRERISESKKEYYRKLRLLNENS